MLTNSPPIQPLLGLPRRNLVCCQRQTSTALYWPWATEPVMSISCGKCHRQDTSIRLRTFTSDRRYSKDSGSSRLMQRVASIAVGERWVTHIAWPPAICTRPGTCASTTYRYIYVRYLIAFSAQSYLACALADGSVTVMTITQTLTSSSDEPAFHTEYDLEVSAEKLDQVLQPDKKATTSLRWINTSQAEVRFTAVAGRGMLTRSSPSSFSRSQAWFTSGLSLQRSPHGQALAGYSCKDRSSLLARLLSRPSLAFRTPNGEMLWLSASPMALSTSCRAFRLSLPSSRKRQRTISLRNRCRRRRDRCSSRSKRTT